MNDAIGTFHFKVRFPPFNSDATAGPAKTHGYTKMAKKGSIIIVALKSNVGPVYDAATWA